MADDDLVYFRHHQSGAPHGFSRRGIEAAGRAIDARLAKVPNVVEQPLEDIVGQVRKGHLIPCDAPDARTVQGVILTPEQEAALAKGDVKLSKAEERAQLLARLAELGDEDGVEEPGADVAVGADSMAGEPATTAARTARKGR